MIRAATCADAATIAAIWNGVIALRHITFTTDRKSPDEVAAMIDARDGAFWVAEVAGQVAGFATFGAFRSRGTRVAIDVGRWEHPCIGRLHGLPSIDPKHNNQSV